MKKIENSCKLEQFKSFLDENDINNELFTDTDYEGKAFKYIKFQFPVARGFETISVYDDDNLDAIINTQFTKYRGICDYEAFWSKELKCIECEIQDGKMPSPGRIMLKRFPPSLEVGNETIDEFGKKSRAK